MQFGVIKALAAKLLTFHAVCLPCRLSIFVFFLLEQVQFAGSSMLNVTVSRVCVCVCVRMRVCVCAHAVDEADIIELEKQYWSLKGTSKSGRFDVETLTSVVSPPMPQQLCQGLSAVYLLAVATLSVSEWVGQGYIHSLDTYHVVCYVLVKPRLHDTTGYMFVYTIQPVVKPVVKPVWQPGVSCIQTFNRFDNRFDNRLDVCLHDTAGCQTGCTTSLTTGCIV